jgi:hypothetical protein
LIGTTGNPIPGSGKLRVQGNVRITGTYSCSVTTDLSENIASADTALRELEVGDVVVVDPTRDEHIALSRRSYDPAVVGIIAGKPGVLLGADLDGKAVALAGRVPTKVTAENGPISRGDLLVTSSKPGYAMRGDPDRIRPGMVLGKAMGVLEKGEGTLVVLVNLQ